jgi:hypothetical protein
MKESEAPELIVEMARMVAEMTGLDLPSAP